LFLWESNFNLTFNPLVHLPVQAADECDGDDYGTSGEFDFYVFQQTWSAEYCYGDGDPGCKDPTPFMQSNLTIHGLWPNYDAIQNGYDWPQCCTSKYGQTLNQSVIDANLDDLHFYWPDEAGTPWPTYTTSDFWQHEWGKHGVCTGLDPNTYIKDAIHAVEIQAGTPSIISDNIGKSVARSAIEASYNNGKACTPDADCWVALSCSGGQYLEDVTTCWTKDYQPMICPALTVTGSATCTASTLQITSF